MAGRQRHSPPETTEKGTLGAAIGDKPVRRFPHLADGRRGRRIWCLGPRRATGPSPGRQTTKRCGYFRRYEVPLQIVRLDIAHRKSAELENARADRRHGRVTATTEFAITPSGDAYT